jgi:hypothetical protein
MINAMRDAKSITILISNLSLTFFGEENIMYVIMQSIWLIEI